MKPLLFMMAPAIACAGGSVRLDWSAACQARMEKAQQASLEIDRIFEAGTFVRERGSVVFSAADPPHRGYPRAFRAEVNPQRGIAGVEQYLGDDPNPKLQAIWEAAVADCKRMK
jgi:hypothetical protein